MYIQYLSLKFQTFIIYPILWFLQEGPTITEKVLHENSLSKLQYCFLKGLRKEKKKKGRTKIRVVNTYICTHMTGIERKAKET